MPAGVTDKQTQMVRGLFGPGIAVHGLATDDAGTTTLLPTEARAMTRARPARLREFTAGRQAARMAMAQLDLPPVAVAMGADRAPVWPAGLVGSISHAAGFAVAVLARQETTCSLGVDLEPDRALERELWDSILLPAEQGWISTQPEPEQGSLARLFFSAKECAYKCQYPLTRNMLEFDALHITFPGNGRFKASFRHDSGRFAKGTCLTGQFAIAHGLIATGMALTATR